MSEPANNASAVVLISGGGSNLQAFIDASAAGEIAVDVVLVCSNRSDAFGLQRARDAGIPTEHIDNERYTDRESFDAALAKVIDQYQPDMLILAGFMRILSTRFVQRYAGRILNIHPSLLPSYPGMRTHERAINAGDAWHGCTVHFVAEELDAGPRIIQGRVAVEANDSPAALAERVLEIEHQIYPIAANLLAQGRIRYADDQAWFDDRALINPIEFRPGEAI